MKTGQIIEEREDSVKMKMRFKRFLSGFMAVATLASVIIQPVAVSASELEPEEIPFEQQYAELKGGCWHVVSRGFLVRYRHYLPC